MGLHRLVHCPTYRQMFNGQYLTINFDGVARGNLGPFKVGCIFRVHDGKILATEARKLPTETNNSTLR